MKNFMSLCIIIIVGIIVSGCGGGGASAPSDDDNISVVKVIDLKLGYLAKGIILADAGEDFHYDLGFCNDEITMKIYGDYIDDQYGEGTYEIIGEGVIVYANGDALIDTGDSGTLEEGKTYLIEQQAPNNLNWYIGSISTIEECVPVLNIIK